MSAAKDFADLNAVSRLAEVLPAFIGSRATWQLFESAGLVGQLRAPADARADESDFRQLHLSLRSALGSELAGRAARSAGLRLADQFLERRVAGSVQALMKRLPAAPAARWLLVVLRRHAPDFAGSAVFSAGIGMPLLLQLQHNPLCRNVRAQQQPTCDFYAAFFERLFRLLVHPQASALETACEACGDSACRFELRWPPMQDRADLRDLAVDRRDPAA